MAPARKGKKMAAVVKYAPLVYAAAQQYGPQVVEAVRKNKGPAEQLVTKKTNATSNRRKALEHANSVVAGSMMQVFHEGHEFWVVFSHDAPIGTFPWTTTPFDVLLAHADLDKRIYPVETKGTFGRRVLKGRSQDEAGQPPQDPQTF